MTLHAPARPSSDPSPELVRQTFLWDRVRGSAQGLVETIWQLFALLIAIRIFEANESIKQFIPAAMGIGLMLTPLSLSFFSRSQLRVSTLLAIVWCAVAVCFFVMIIAPNTFWYVVAIATAQLCATQGVSLITSIYATNYPPSERGGRLSTIFVIGGLLAVSFGYLGGKLLDINPEFYRLILGFAVVGALIYAFACYQIPTKPAIELRSSNAFRTIALAWEDRLFSVILIGWMLMGLGNLMLIPIRVEYLANPDYGINASNAQVSAILVSTVLGMRLLSTRLWGYLFDRMNMINLRIILNVFFGSSILFFFFTENLWIMAIGAALLGIAFGGGGIMWSLFVTKIAPRDKITGYMSVHGFLTGLRMAFAPFLGYAVVSNADPRTAATIAIILIIVSTFIFLPLRGKMQGRSDLHAASETR